MAIHSLDVPHPAPQRPSLAAFERVYTAEFAFVWRVLRRFGVPQEQLEDAAQDVFVVWVRRGAELGRLASARTCLYGIARRVAADQRRAAARARRRHDALALAALDHGDSVEHTLETRHALGVVDRALQDLPELQRETYWLAEVEGLSAHQIGEALQVSPNTVSSRLRLARQRLAVALGDGRPAREEPPTESRTRVWAVLLPIWDAHRDLATSAAGSAPFLLGMTLCAALAAVAWRPAPALPTAPAATAAPLTPTRPAGATLERLLRAEPPDADPADPLTTTTTTPRPPPRRPAEDPLAREARLLARAQRQLADDRPDQALATLDEHAAAAPHGRLADEREALRAAARCRRGERAAGLAAAERWFAGRPDAPALRTARARCAAPENSHDE